MIVDSYLKGLNHLINCAKMKLTHKSILLATVALLPLQVSAQMHGGDGGYAPAPVMAYLPPPLPAPVAAVPNIVSRAFPDGGLVGEAPIDGEAPTDGESPVAPVVVPQPTGMNKILVEKYGWDFVDGTAYAPGTAPAPAAPVPGGAFPNNLLWKTSARVNLKSDKKAFRLERLFKGC